MKSSCKRARIKCKPNMERRRKKKSCRHSQEKQTQRKREKTKNMATLKQAGRRFNILRIVKRRKRSCAISLLPSIIFKKKKKETEKVK